MKHQAFRIAAVMLSVLLITSTTARAGSIQFAEVVQAVVNGQAGRPRVELRLRSVSQSGRLPAQSGTTAAASGSTSSNGAAEQGAAPAAPGAANNLTQTTADAAQGATTGQVETVDLGDVTGTVCDCGEIPLIKGGFPKWPFLALGGIPFIFIKRNNCVVNCDETPPCIGDQCNPPQVPEPATLILFGSGMLALGAGARRRRARTKTAQEMTNAAAGEV